LAACGLDPRTAAGRAPAIDHYHRVIDRHARRTDVNEVAADFQAQLGTGFDPDGLVAFQLNCTGLRSTGAGNLQFLSSATIESLWSVEDLAGLAD
jgi:transcriptional regulator GlxA family with amidase domain